MIAPSVVWFLNLVICSKHKDQVCSKETKIGSSNEEAFPLLVKNNREVLVSCLPWKCVPTAISGRADIPDVPGCHLLHQVSSQGGSQKLFQ